MSKTVDFPKKRRSLPREAEARAIVNLLRACAPAAVILDCLGLGADDEVARYLSEADQETYTQAMVLALYYGHKSPKAVLKGAKHASLIRATPAALYLLVRTAAAESSDTDDATQAALRSDQNRKNVLRGQNKPARVAKRAARASAIAEVQREWDSGKFKTKDRCVEQTASAHDLNLSAAKRALEGRAKTPAWHAKWSKG